MGLKNWAVLGGVFVVLVAVDGFAVEPVKAEASVKAEKGVKGAWVKVEGRVLKNGVQVSQPATTTLSGRAIQVGMQAWDKDGVSSHLLVDLTPVVKGDEIKVKGDVSVALEDGAKEKVVARVDERVKGGEAVKVAVKLYEDEYLLEFRFEVEE